jgi:hypothetical protein
MFERNYLVAINLNHNELKNPIFHRLSEPPAELDSFEGAFYYNIVDHMLYYFDGNKWVKNTEYVVKLLGESGQNIVSIYEGTNSIGNEFRFRLLKGDDYLKLAASGDYITLSFDSEKLDELYGLSRIIQATPFDDIPLGGTTVVGYNNNRVVFPFTSARSVYDYDRGKKLNEILDNHEQSLNKIVEIFMVDEDEFERRRRSGLEEGVYLVYDEDEPGPTPPTPGDASYDPDTKLITLSGTYNETTGYITVSGTYDPETKLITF